MSTASESELQARIAQLEAENVALRRAQSADDGRAAPPAPRKGRQRWRTVVAVICVVVGLILAPIALLTAWARIELVDTDRFVSTFAPLAEDPDVQAYVADQVTAAIEEQVDLEALTSDLFDGLQQLNLPPRAQDALGLLEGPATQGLQSLVAGAVDRIVASDAFADVWGTALRVTHRQFVAAMQGDPNAALDVSNDTLSVQLGPVIDAVKERLEDQGIGIASAIPSIDRSIVIVQDDAIALVKTMYALAVAAGTWLPIVSLALLVAGVLIAKRRASALVWTAGGFALSMILFAAGVGIGHAFFVGTVSPSIMPQDTAVALYEQLVEIMRGAVLALFVLSLLIAIIAWFTGPWRPARAARGLADSGFTAIRRSAAAHGVTTGTFGSWLDRWRAGAYALIVVVASAVVLFTRPITVGLVVWTVLLSLLALLLVELLRRPTGSPEATARTEPAAG
ncbi:hypothetical protein [Agromyces aerolatus]|uniref:hypothetical protein n=1 Tax=Agromyces sp. LY-1074 TaxID=3074080 RepID=UPI0028666C9E|nr:MULTISPECIES: hypothetical protein [unclassified Agromyces]MDR5698308.1 hypothetical protein [Agromyces sp. LY-1074]MDR5704602.1 hypothetical protein [Agromyces sp. LY-1358]